MKRIIYSLVITLSLLIGLFCVTAINNQVYADSYTYGPTDEIAQAESLVVERVIDSSNLIDSNNLNTTANYKFGNLYDVACYNDLIFIADGSNNKIVVLNNNYQFITSFPEDNSLNSPHGVFITNDYIYVCDYNNSRIVLFDHNYQYVREIGTPDDVAFDNFKFQPKKITVTRTGRIYCIAEGINEGIIDFNPDGTFSRYYGTNSVTVSAWKAFWLLFTSEEQKEAQGYNFGKSLTNLCIDKDEYIYTVSSQSDDGNFIKKLNFKGNDVLQKNGFYTPNGDVKTGTDSNVPQGTSSFVDIDVNEVGTYIALDKTRGRVFGYDFEGNLLYIGGTIGSVQTGITGTISGTFQIPEALCYFNDKILVVDSKNQNLVIMGFTDFGKLINQATNYYYNHDYEQASNIWKEVLRLDTNYYLAYSGIGKAYLREGNYEQAMTNLKLGYDQYNYSIAYEQYRYNKLSKVFPFIVLIILILLIALLIRIAIKNSKREERERKGY